LALFRIAEAFIFKKSPHNWCGSSLKSQDFQITGKEHILAESFRNSRGTDHTETSIIAGLVNIEVGFTPF